MTLSISLPQRVPFEAFFVDMKTHPAMQTQIDRPVQQNILLAEWRKIS